jgi:hypothetical protein
MRAAITWQVNWLILLVVGAGLGLASSRAEAGPSSRAGQSAPDEAVRDFDPVEGRGSNLKDAGREALRKAHRIIVEHLRSLDPPVEWTPSMAFVRDNLLGEPQELLSKKEEVVKGVVVRCWSWPLAISAKNWHAIQEFDRRERAQERMFTLGKVVATLVVFLGLVAGYIRLDEFSKGYYTGWLRLGAVAVFLIVSGGLWVR